MQVAPNPGSSTGVRVIAPSAPKPAPAAPTTAAPPVQRPQAYVSQAPTAAPAPQAAPAAPISASSGGFSGDALYQSQASALAAALAGDQGDYNNQVNQYNQQYSTALQNLGYTPGANGAAGAWNYQDQNAASGRGYQNLLNDYASRGLLQSSLYATALDNFNRSLNQQLTTTQNNKSSYLTNLLSNFTQQKDTNTQQLQEDQYQAAQRAAAALIGTGS